MRMLGTLAGLALACFGLAFASPAEDAEDGRPALDEETEKGAYARLVGARLTDPSLTSAISPPGLAFQLTTDSRDRRARAKIGLRLGSDLFLDVKFSVPAGDAGSEAEPIDLDGLRRSSVVDLGLHFLAWEPRLDAALAGAILDEFLARHPGTKKRVLSLAGLADDPDLRRRFLQAVTWSTALFAAVRVKVGRQDFSYVDSSLKTLSEQRTSLALEAAAGILLPGWGYFGVDVEAQRFHEAGSSADLILPYRGGPLEHIRTVVMEPPARRRRTRFMAEYRNLVGTFAGLNPRLSYFPKEKVTLAELVLYGFRDPDSGLNGGVNISWTSRRGGLFGLALFIGAAFSLTPG